jgi:hypothetical protein
MVEPFLRRRSRKKDKRPLSEASRGRVRTQHDTGVKEPLVGLPNGCQGLNCYVVSRWITLAAIQAISPTGTIKDSRLLTKSANNAPKRRGMRTK